LQQTILRYYEKGIRTNQQRKAINECRREF